MADKYKEFDRSRLRLQPLSERIHDLGISSIMPLAPAQNVRRQLHEAAAAMLAAKSSGASSILMMGAHVLRSGVQRYIIDLMERGLLSCIAMNGAGAIHDYEFALIGATTESVSKYIREGRFGMWDETSRINDIVADGAKNGMGIGEAVGRAIAASAFPHRGISVLAAAYNLGIPATVHVGIGNDITHQHPNFDGAAYGAASYRDFLRYTAALESAEGGIVMNFGSSVMAPEVFLKALSMVRNAAHAEGRRVDKITTLVCDLHELPESYRTEASKSDSSYYFRPWKTMLVRTVADGGESHYVCGRHAETIPELWTAATAAGNGPAGEEK